MRGWHSQLVFAAAVALFCSCATSSYNMRAGNEHTQFLGPVLVYEGHFPPGVDAQVIGQFVEEKDGYGEPDKVIPRVMWRAGQLGANGILVRKQGTRMSLYSWAAPYVEGDLLWISNYNAAASNVDPVALLSALDWLYHHKLINEDEYQRRKTLIQSRGQTAPPTGNDAH